MQHSERSKPPQVTRKRTADAMSTDELVKLAMRELEEKKKAKLQAAEGNYRTGFELLWSHFQYESY